MIEAKNLNLTSKNWNSARRRNKRQSKKNYNNLRSTQPRKSIFLKCFRTYPPVTMESILPRARSNRYSRRWMFDWLKLKLKGWFGNSTRTLTKKLRKNNSLICIKNALLTRMRRRVRTCFILHSFWCTASQTVSVLLWRTRLNCCSWDLKLKWKSILRNLKKSK
jgi:hypothetical protein